MENTQETAAANTDNGKTIAIISYITLIGWIIAYVMYGNNKTPLAAYHLRQTLTLYIVSLGLWIIEMLLALIPVIGLIIGILMIFVYIALFVFWVMGLISAVNGQEKPMPVFGAKAQEWFKGMK